MPLRILQLVNRVPWPLNDGGAIGVHYYIEGYLNAGAELSLLCMNTSRHFVDVATLPPVYKLLKHFIAIPVDNEVKPLAALKSLASGSSYNIVRFISEACKLALARLLTENEYDVVHLDGLYLAPYISLVRQHSNALVVMRHHNVEHRIWERLATSAGGFFKKQYLAMLAKRMKVYEQAMLSKVDVALPISTQDAALLQGLGYRGRLLIHPFGIDTASLPSFQSENTDYHAVYHLGAMDWLPNQESVDWLLAEVWPLVMKETSAITLHLAGRNMPERYLKLRIPNVVVAGEVPDAAAYEQDKAILLVPLKSGGGVRIKILRAMASGKCVISTTVGMEGIEAYNTIHALLADTAKDFAAQILYASANPEAAATIGRNAETLIRQRYDSRKLMQELMNYYTATLKNKT